MEIIFFLNDSVIQCGSDEKQEAHLYLISTNKIVGLCPNICLSQLN